jgi:hypothetical protein
MRWNVIAAFINLNPSILEAIKLFSLAYLSGVNSAYGPRKDTAVSLN